MKSIVSKILTESQNKPLLSYPALSSFAEKFLNYRLDVLIEHLEESGYEVIKLDGATISALLIQSFSGHEGDYQIENFIKDFKKSPVLKELVVAGKLKKSRM